MSDQSGPEKPQGDEYTYADAALSCFLIFLVIFGSMFVFISFRGQPHGTQIATLISYTGFVFVATFFSLRSEFTRYDLDEPYVQEQFPRLLGIHCIYAVTLYFAEGWALSIRKSLPAWWTHSSGSKDEPPFDTVLMLVIGISALSQILVSRGILARAKKREKAILAGE